MHANQPWRWCILLNSKSISQSWRKRARFEVLHPDLILFAFVVDITVGRYLRFLLVLKKRVVQDLIVNVDFSHLRLHALSHFLFQSLVGIVSIAFISHFGDPCLLDELRQLERYLMDASLVLEISTFLSPMSWNWHRVTDLLTLQEKQWILSRRVPCLHKVRALNPHLQVKDFHLVLELALLLCKFIFNLIRLLHPCLFRREHVLHSIWSFSRLWLFIIQYEAHRGVFLIQFLLHLLVKPFEDLLKLKIGGTTLSKQVRLILVCILKFYVHCILIRLGLDFAFGSVSRLAIVDLYLFFQLPFLLEQLFFAGQLLGLTVL